MTMDYFGLDAQPISQEEWLDLWHQRQIARRNSPHGESPPETDPTRIASSYVGDAWVSTVWLGIDHGPGEGHPPIIFETMIFGGDYDGEQWRWYTKEQALAGHNDIVAKIRARVPHASLNAH